MASVLFNFHLSEVVWIKDKASQQVEQVDCTKDKASQQVEQVDCTKDKSSLSVSVADYYDSVTAWIL